MHRSGCRRGSAAAGVSLFSERYFHPAAGARPKILRAGGDTETLYVCMYVCMYISLAQADSVYYMLRCKYGKAEVDVCMYNFYRTLTELDRLARSL